VLQRGAVYCSAVQCVAVCCSVLQCGAVYCSVVQCVRTADLDASRATASVCCSASQCVAVCCSVYRRVELDASTTACVAACCSVWQRVAARSSVLQYIAARCSVLCCVAVCCSVLQCIAECCSVYRRAELDASSASASFISITCSSHTRISYVKHVSTPNPKCVAVGGCDAECSNACCSGWVCCSTQMSHIKHECTRMNACCSG